MREPEQPLDQLALHAQAGSEEAYRGLFDRFRPAVERTARKVAERWRGGGNPDFEADVCQEGFLGLLHAVRNYDPGKGPFEPWALKHITWAVKSGVYRSIGLEPREARAVLRGIRTLREQGTDDPSPEEVAPIAGLDVDKVRGILATLRTESIDDEAFPEIADREDAAVDQPQLLHVLQACRELGRDGLKFSVLLVLRDMEYEWSEITRLLTESPLFDWAETLKTQYPSVLEVFPEARGWPAVREAFRTPPPASTPESLRQFFCRLRQRVLRVHVALA